MPNANRVEADWGRCLCRRCLRQILSRKFWYMPQLGCINVHGSILPKYRGAAPIQWCLYHGETGNRYHNDVNGCGDGYGAILLKATPIHAGQCSRFGAEASPVGGRFMVETLLKLERREIQPIPQKSLRRPMRQIQKQDYLLDWSRPAIALHNQVRGFFPTVLLPFEASC